MSLVYYYFGSRAGLLEATLVYADEESPSSTLSIESGNGSAYAKLEKAMLAELGGSRSWRSRAIVWNELTASAVFDEKMRKHVDAVNGKWAESVASFIACGRQDGSIRQDVDPHEEADLLTSLLDGLLLRLLTKALPRRRAVELLRSMAKERLQPQKSK